ncbi:mechanosensitive ion channel protein [Clostridium tetani]|uniref:Mechanosensitive ion channel family protein n=1 Tax=Clostridium tetani TaxID=1513 RepID=A0A4Q0VA03_CLOTA|nr:mechanosensitive ion channel family protein [Clostridium tetani]RXI46654.1 mechanosensitive ion channel family protein [Clostridium tetani]BDR68496.1 mechanosensitive ion channel protein [Clostridium tetani]BDR74058.1 mechanosensitive ion channel protein [Clostridium tetani]BDR82427.1 mechanosensitive ion channel protein [Clostridium tetani]BDR90817.1 mechanosensitive ion channel protein [Clostridium tetani]
MKDSKSLNFNNFFMWVFKIIKKENIQDIIFMIIKIVIVLFIMFIMIKVGNKLIDKSVTRQRKTRFSLNDKKSKTIGAVLKSILKYSVYFLGIFTIAEMTFGIKGITLAGIGGVALGFGAQNLVKDVINGFFILFEEQYVVGDLISVNGRQGIVESIELRVTRIRDFNGDLYIIPNGAIGEVTNHSTGFSRALVEINISNDENIDKVNELLGKVCNEYKAKNENMIEGPDIVGITKLDETSVTIRIVGKAKPLTHWNVEMELRKLINNLLDKEGIKRPYSKIKILKENEVSIKNE